MRHFLAPSGQPEMMRKNFMHRHLHFFMVLLMHEVFLPKYLTNLLYLYILHIYSCNRSEVPK